MQCQRTHRSATSESDQLAPGTTTSFITLVKSVTLSTALLFLSLHNFPCRLQLLKLSIKVTNAFYEAL